MYDNYIKGPILKHCQNSIIKVNQQLALYAISTNIKLNMLTLRLDNWDTRNITGVIVLKIVTEATKLLHTQGQCSHTASI